MSAETLRRAAALMRERAMDATGGGWSAYDGTAAPTHVRSRWTDEQGRRCQCVVAEAHAARDESQAQDAIYIASMQPAVALAVADWLDSEAHDGETLAEVFASLGDGPVNWEYGGLGKALAVARAYLGEGA